MADHPVVLRISKLAKPGNLAGSLSHTFRTRDTPNADPLRTGDNTVLMGGGDADQVNELIGQRLAQLTSRRGDEVPVVEYLITANQLAFAEHGGPVDAQRFFSDSLDWLKRKHGAENIVCAVVHNDEQAPHLVAYIVPIIEKPCGKRKRSVIVGTNADGSKIRETREFETAPSMILSAKTFFGGKKKLSEMQTDFAQAVGIKHNLVRGEIGSKASHREVRHFYTEMQAELAEAKRRAAVAEASAQESERRAVEAEARVEVAERRVDTLKDELRLLLRGIMAAFTALTAAAQKPVTDNAGFAAQKAISAAFSGLAENMPGLADLITSALEPAAVRADLASAPPKKYSLFERLLNSGEQAADEYQNKLSRGPK